MGHRNPQGLYYDKDKDLILEIHGPMGGDEINIIQVKILIKIKAKFWLANSFCWRALWGKN